MSDVIKPDFEAIAKAFFPDTHREKYVYDGPHQSISKQWLSDQDQIEANRMCFIDGYKKAYNEYLSTVKRLQEENEELKASHDETVSIKFFERLQEEKKLSLAFLKEAEAWLSFNNHPSKENIADFKNSVRDLLKQLEHDYRFKKKSML